MPPLAALSSWAPRKIQRNTITERVPDVHKCLKRTNATAFRTVDSTGTQGFFGVPRQRTAEFPFIREFARTARKSFDCSNWTETSVNIIAEKKYRDLNQHSRPEDLAKNIAARSNKYSHHYLKEAGRQAGLRHSSIRTVNATRATHREPPHRRQLACAISRQAESGNGPAGIGSGVEVRRFDLLRRQHRPGIAVRADPVAVGEHLGDAASRDPVPLHTWRAKEHSLVGGDGLPRPRQAG